VSDAFDLAQRQISDAVYHSDRYPCRHSNQQWKVHKTCVTDLYSKQSGTRADSVQLACIRIRHNPAGIVPVNIYDAKLSLLIAVVSENPANSPAAQPAATLLAEAAVAAGIFPISWLPLRYIVVSLGASYQSAGMLPVHEVRQGHAQ